MDHTLREAVSDPHSGQDTTRDWAFREFGAIVALVVGVISLVVVVADMLR
jgi:hypothetical protein